MKLKSFLFSLILTLLGSFSALASNEEQLSIPNWQLNTQAGEAVTWQQLKGKPLILHFWATWCPYCKKLQPGLSRLYQKYQSQGLQLMAISFREDPGTRPQEVLTERGYQFQTLVDGDAIARDVFGVSGTPTTIFIHANGEVMGVTRTSDPDDPRLEKAVKLLLAEYQP